MKDFLVTQLNTQMKFTVGLNERQGELVLVGSKVAHLKVLTHTISVRIAAIDIAERA